MTQNVARSLCDSWASWHITACFAFSLQIDQCHIPSSGCSASGDRTGWIQTVAGASEDEMKVLHAGMGEDGSETRRRWMRMEMNFTRGRVGIDVIPVTSLGYRLLINITVKSYVLPVVFTYRRSTTSVECQQCSCCSGEKSSKTRHRNPQRLHGDYYGTCQWGINCLFGPRKTCRSRISKEG